MWTISGPFDGPTVGDVSHSVSKLLKSGKKYKIGRKDSDLVVNHKKVSGEHAHIAVGGYTAEDVANPDAIPTLEVINSKGKGMHIYRDDIKETVNPSAPQRLEDGDVLEIVGGIRLIVRWHRICCFETPGRGRTPVYIDGCAALGINVVRAHHPSTTHHIIPSYTLTPATAASLLTATQFVKPEWLQKLLHLGMLEKHEQGSLEAKFELPSETKARPGFSASLQPPLKTFATWEPNEARLNMLRGCRFIFVGEKGHEISSDYQTLITRGGGDYEAFTVSAGVQKWQRLLTRSQMRADSKKVKIFLVAEEDAMVAAVGPEQWEEMVSEAKSLSLQFIMPENILQAVAHVDKFYLDSLPITESASSSKLLSVTPSSHEEETAAPPDTPVRKGPPCRTTRASSQAPSELPASAPPTSDAISEAPRPARKAPPRRAAARNPAELLGLDDSIVEEVTPSTSKSVTPAPTKPPSSLKPLSASATSQGRPKRRVPGSSNVNELLGLDDDIKESKEATQLNKYKALFDASDPDRVVISSSGTAGETQYPATQTQVGGGTGTRGTIYDALAKVAEEEEESQSTSLSTARGTKRKAAAEVSDDVDAEMQEMLADPNADGPDDTQSPVKRRAVEGVNAVKPRSTSQTVVGSQVPKLPTFVKPPSAAAGKKKGAEVGKPDKDENFLKAINSSKRGKKNEDEFDREFNKLRISKPDLARDEQKNDWAILDDFGNDNVRGNFMVLVEMDIDSTAEPVHRVRSGGKPEWEGKPDFKKFKKQKSAEKRPVIELVVSEENDYGVGAFWKPHSQSQDTSTDRAPPRSKTQTQTQKKGKRPITISDSDDDDDAAPPVLRKGKNKSALPPPVAPKTRTRSGSHSSQQGKGKAALFLPDDDDDDDDAPRGRLDGLDEAEEFEMADDPEADEDEAMTATLRSSTRNTQEVAPRAARSRTAQKRRAHDSDSDDAGFKGFRRKKGRIG